jgi:hypothetical protein
MSDADNTHVSAHHPHDEPASGHGHTPAAEPLGPVDVTAWSYSLVGAAVGAIVALALFVARGG